MKHNFLGVLILGTLFFGACNDDDNDSKTMTFNGENLTVSVSGMSRSGKEATLEGTTLTVKNAIPGESETSFTVENTGDKIVGTNSNTNRDVTLDGTLANGKLDLALTMDVKHKMANKWGVDSIYFTITMSDTASQMNQMTAAMIQAIIPQLNKAGLIKRFVTYLDLGKDGQIIANYPQEGVSTSSPRNMALYNVINEQVVVTLDLAAILADAGIGSSTETFTPTTHSRESYNPLLGIMSAVDNGLPLLMKDHNSEGVLVYVNKEMMEPFLSVLLPLISEMEGDLGGFKDTIIGVANLIQWSKECELGIYLGPYVEMPTPEVNMSNQQNWQELIRTLQR